MHDKTVHDEVRATLAWMKTKDNGLDQKLKDSYGYAVFPGMGRAGVVVGGATGGGEVFEQGRPIGLATLSQLTIGVQVGGQTYCGIILFKDKRTLDRFRKQPGVAFAANASVTIIKFAAAGTTNYSSAYAKTYSRGGLLLELALGGQRFRFLEHEFPLLEGGRDGGKRTDGERGAEPAKSGERAKRRHHAEERNGGGRRMEVGRIDIRDLKRLAEEEGKKSGTESEGRGSSQRVQLRASRRSGGVGSGDGAGARGGEEREGRKRGEGEPERPSAAAERSAAAETRETSRRGRREEPRHFDLRGAARKLAANAAGKAAGVLDAHRGSIAWRAVRALLHDELKSVDRAKRQLLGVRKEATIAPVLREEVKAALGRMYEKKPGLKEAVEKAHGYAVFPTGATAAAVLGGTYARGEVFQSGKLIGYGGVARMTIGMQLGGETFDELILFDDCEALERFKRGTIAFAANASMAFLTVGAAMANDHAERTRVFLHSSGGLMVEAGIGAQKFVFVCKVLGDSPGEGGSPKAA